MKYSLYLYLMLAFAVSMIACNDTDKQVNNSAQIIGYWLLQSGLRDKQPTGTLDGTWVKIDANNYFSTNLPVADSEPVPFEIKKGKILTSGASKMEYTISNVTDTTMTLSFSAKGFDFDLNLQKTTPDSTDINL